jgi:hypothetical protein
LFQTDLEYFFEVIVEYKYIDRVVFCIYPEWFMNCEQMLEVFIGIFYEHHYNQLKLNQEEDITLK